ncbi:hypothetical protein P152DRAFT_513342 [Eremomyces bilateralis CBS 781.70]|uniref:Uncharacterized protein n=1 Tax=Eremomyces bilateralis CBS 781.70 TaxID=1392243 RepID=A0A6G1G7I2_9PEZI|nr:uncharacterized protein P152DRAFT_513342 [Eremomyces bilateralis CBS 781.70]KAF1814018.1 hypothetical protein P152DRAFT_513342 [Eremomyces bilateralis CBS 781.70]
MSSSQSGFRERTGEFSHHSEYKPNDEYNNHSKSLIDGGIYFHVYEYPDERIPAKPNNWEEINQRLAQRRPSLSPFAFTDEAHGRFVRADAHAAKEKQVSESGIPIIEGEIEDARCRSGGIPFTNLDYLTDDAIVPGNPDIYYGARPEQLNRQVRDGLGGHIVPSTQHDLPILPNFMLEAKESGGSAAVAKRQASHGGAFGARGTQSLLSYGRDERNARGWAREHMDGVIHEANTRASGTQAVMKAVDVSFVSETSMVVSDRLYTICQMKNHLILVGDRSHQQNGGNSITEENRSRMWGLSGCPLLLPQKIPEHPCRCRKHQGPTSTESQSIVKNDRVNRKYVGLINGMGQPTVPTGNWCL